VLLAQHVEEQQHFTKRALGKFAEQVEAKFEVQDAKIDSLEAGASKDQSAIEELQLRMAACETNQAKQAQLLQMADANGCITRADLNLGEFDRPINLEVFKILSPKFVSIASIQHAITPFACSCGFPVETWNIQGNTDGRNFSVQFLQNAFTSTKNVDKCVASLKDEEGNWKQFFAEVAKTKHGGIFETC
jgi:hypothetical protein